MLLNHAHEMSSLFGNVSMGLPSMAATSFWLITGFRGRDNNKIKVIKRMVYRFRDDEYFFLKIRAALPGIT